MDKEQNVKRDLCIVEIVGDGCASCHAILPILREIASRRGDVRFEKVELGEETAPLIEKWKVDRVPAVLLTDAGVPFARCYGYQPEEILEIWIDAKISEYLNGQN